MTSNPTWAPLSKESRRFLLTEGQTAADTFAKVRSRGHWRVAIRPEKFVEARLDSLAKVEALAEHCKLSLRGWDFPHIGRREGTQPRRMSDYLEQTTDWEFFVEVWRLYQSAQFIYFGGFPDDWNDQAGTPLWRGTPSSEPILRVGDTIFRATEVCEFAARLAQAVPGEDGFVIELELVGLSNRNLVVYDPRRADFSFPRVASLESWGRRLRISRADLVTAAQATAVSFCVGLFARFGWDTNEAFLREYQQTLQGR
jgi:hypothetical protein